MLKASQSDLYLYFYFADEYAELLSAIHCQSPWAAFAAIIIESKNIKYLKRSDKSANLASYVIQNFFPTRAL